MCSGVKKMEKWLEKGLIVAGTNQLKDYADFATIILVIGKHKTNKKIRNFSIF